MNAVACLLWYESRRTAWVLYGAVIGLALYAGILLLLPASVTGADLAGIPRAGEEPDPRSQSRIEIETQEDDASGASIWSRFEWSFDSTRSTEDSREVDGEDAKEGAGDHAGSDAAEDDSTMFELPDELQFALRPRQPTAMIGAMLLAGATLLGFFVAHVRESQQGEMALHYQSPVSPETQLGVRFLFMVGASLGVFVAALAVYYAIQTSQSLSPTFPLAEGFGSTAQVTWTHWLIASATTQTLPAAAFILLFVQVQNAYGLLGGARLAGFVTASAGLAASLASYERFFLAAPADAQRLEIVTVHQVPLLGQTFAAADLTRFRLDVPVEFIAAGLAATAVMLLLATRIFREVEWS